MREIKFRAKGLIDNQWHCELHPPKGMVLPDSMTSLA